MMLFARDVLTRNRGATILFDVKCSQRLAPPILAAGGKPLMWKTGHSLIKAKMREIGAPLAGEMSGHIFFKERWFGFDDATYTAARLLEIVSASADPSAVLNALPTSFSTPELNVPCAEGEPAEVVARLRAEAKFPGAREIVTIDGVRVEYADGFGLVRASNTTPVLVLRFEGTTPEALARIEADCLAALRAVKPDAQIGDGGALTRAATRASTSRHARPDRQAVVARRRRPHPAGGRRHPRRASRRERRLGRRAGVRAAGRARRRRRRGDRVRAPALDQARLVARRRRAPSSARFVARLRRHRYDAVIDLQGLTKSALIAQPRRTARPTAWPTAPTAPATNGRRAGWCATRSGSSRTAMRSIVRASWSPRRWLRVPTSRRRSGWRRPRRPSAGPRTVVLIHGTSRADKLWPEASWIELGKRLVAAGWAIALPQASAEEKARAERIAAGGRHRQRGLAGARHRRARSIAWRRAPARSASTAARATSPSRSACRTCRSTTSPTAWRTGPQVQHGARHQLSIEGQPTPDVAAVWAAWQTVQPTPPGRLP